jgi:nucleotide-binding universal stress UspA family protein
MSRVRPVMHPSDFSAASRPALAKAIETARERRAELLIVHVLSTVLPMVGDGYLSPQTYDDMVRASRSQGQRRLDALVAATRKKGVRVRGLLLDGIAWEQLIRAARTHRASLIVMGTHGRTGLARLFLGSVAERVIGSAPCPVLTVRAGR